MLSSSETPISVPPIFITTCLSGGTETTAARRIGGEPSALSADGVSPIFHLEAIAAALHRAPAGFLVDKDAAAAIVEQIASNAERCLQVLFFLETIIDQPDELDAPTDAPAS